MPRKQKKYHYIYKTTNLLSGKYYIGMHSTSNLEDGYMGSGKRLRYSINKYGKENHKVEILEFVNSREELKKREEEIVNLNEIAKIDCMNLQIGGGGGGGFSSIDHKKKFMKAGNKATNDLMWIANRKKYTKKLSTRTKKMWGDPEIRNKLMASTGFKNKSHSAKAKEKISKSNRGKHTGTKNSQYGTCWITNGKKNKKISITNLIPEGWNRGRKNINNQ